MDGGAGELYSGRLFARKIFPFWHRVEALIAARRHPNLILLDVGLPDMTGFDVCLLLKRNPATKHIPVVFMSASHTDVSAVYAGRFAGGPAYLFHPATPEELLAVVNGAMVKAAAANKRGKAAN